MICLLLEVPMAPRFDVALFVAYRFKWPVNAVAIPFAGSEVKYPSSNAIEAEEEVSLQMPAAEPS